MGLRLTNDIRTPNTGNNVQSSKQKEARESAKEPEKAFEEPAVLLELSFKPRGEDEKSKIFSAVRDKAETDKTAGGLDDASGRLTKRLVAAQSKEEVQTILAEAYKNLGEALKAAAGGDEEAIKVIKRLNKLIRRATRKVRDLDKENDLRQKTKKAEKEQLELLAKQLKDELKRRIEERKKREKNYLRDADKKDDDDRPPVIGRPSIAALEAKIMAISQQLQQSAAAPSSSGEMSFGTVSQGGDAGSTEESAEISEA